MSTAHHIPQHTLTPCRLYRGLIHLDGIFANVNVLGGVDLTEDVFGIVDAGEEVGEDGGGGGWGVEAG